MALSLTILDSRQKIHWLLLVHTSQEIFDIENPSFESNHGDFKDSQQAFPVTAVTTTTPHPQKIMGGTFSSILKANLHPELQLQQ